MLKDPGSPPPSSRTSSASAADDSGELAYVAPDTKEFPEFRRGLLPRGHVPGDRALLRVDHARGCVRILRDFLDAGYSFVNERLAARPMGSQG